MQVHHTGIKGRELVRNSQRATSSQNGFTLVELALVLIIIGLLGGAALKGREMIANSRNTATVSQVQAFQRAVGTFHDSYLALPGDFNAAQICLKDCSTANSCFNGDGDGNVGATAVAWQSIDATINSENTQLWRHLALADLVYGLAPTGTQTGFTLTQPASKLDGGYFARQASASAGLPDGLVLVLRADPAGAWQGGTRGMVISPKEAAKIDRKIDDGYAFTGYAYAISNGHADGCGNANTGGAGSYGYNETSALRSCDMIFKLWPAPP